MNQGKRLSRLYPDPSSTVSSVFCNPRCLLLCLSALFDQIWAPHYLCIPVYLVIYDSGKVRFEHLSHSRHPSQRAGFPVQGNRPPSSQCTHTLNEAPDLARRERGFVRLVSVCFWLARPSHQVVYLEGWGVRRQKTETEAGCVCVCACVCVRERESEYVRGSEKKERATEKETKSERAKERNREIESECTADQRLIFRVQGGISDKKLRLLRTLQ